MRDGWNLTGDTFVRDDDGYFWYQARSDDMIISSGYNIAAPEVEEALLKHPAVAECAVIGVPDEARGHARQGVRRGRGRRGPEPSRPASCRTSSRPRSRRTSTRARSSSSTSCRRTATGKLQRFRLRTLDA